MKTILVLVDFSARSRHVAKYAFAAAQYYKTNLLFYNAYYIPNAVTPDSGSYQPYYGDYEEYEKQSYSKLKELGKELCDQASQTSNAELPHIEYQNDLGRIGDNIQELLLKNDIWLAVMGEKREIFLDNLLTGSDSAHILRNATCPIILVPDQVQFTPFRLITVASSSIDRHEVAALDFALDLIEGTGAQIRIVHVLAQEKSSEVSRAEKINTNIFNKSISFYTMKAGKIEDALVDYIKNEGSDLLILIHKEYEFFEDMFHHSVTKKIATNHVVPTLIFNS